MWEITNIYFTVIVEFEMDLTLFTLESVHISDWRVSYNNKHHSALKARWESFLH